MSKRLGSMDPNGHLSKKSRVSRFLSFLSLASIANDRRRWSKAITTHRSLNRPDKTASAPIQNRLSLVAKPNPLAKSLISTLLICLSRSS